MSRGPNITPQRRGRDDAVIKLFYQFVQPGPHLYLKDRISQKMLLDALNHLGPIPREEWVLCMIDDPVVQYPVDKMILTVQGIYWWDAEHREKKEVRYSELDAVRFLQTRDSEPEFDPFSFKELFKGKEEPEYTSTLYLVYAHEGGQEELNLSNLNTDQLNMLTSFIRGALMIQEVLPTRPIKSVSHAAEREWQLLHKENHSLLGPFNLELLGLMVADGTIRPQEYCVRLKESTQWIDFEEDPALNPLLSRQGPSKTWNPMSPNDLIDFGLSEHTEGPVAAPPPLSPIDLNTASLDELLMLTDMTLAMAEKWIQERASNSTGYPTMESVGVFLGLAPHQVVRLKREAHLKERKAKPSRRTRIVDY